MTTVTINDHKIMLLTGMTKQDGGMGPGAYDAILYRGFEITTYEGGQTGLYTGMYIGPFAYGPEGEGPVELKVKTLAAVKAGIDRLMGRGAKV